MEYTVDIISEYTIGYALIIKWKLIQNQKTLIRFLSIDQERIADLCSVFII